MRRTLIVTAIALALATAAQAQVLTAPPPAPEVNLPLSYVAANARVGLGINDQGDLSGEARGFFAADNDSAWFAELWLADASAGGVKFGYNWVWGGLPVDPDAATANPVTVAKGFVAIDQNRYQDRKLSLGLGLEREHWFGDLYGSVGTSGNRQIQLGTTTTVNLLSGIEAGRPFQQTETVLTLLRQFERGYDSGLGARVGRFFEPALLRLSGGADYEQGKFGSSQFTVAAVAEKFFSNSGHSLALTVEHASKRGDFAQLGDDTRAALNWRYEFGQRHSFRPTSPFRMVETKRQVATEEASAPIIVKNELHLDATAFFGLDQSGLSAEAQAALGAVVEALKSGQRLGRVTVIGHTCDLGPTAYNQRLSERRAAAVRDWLVARGVAADQFDVSGMGELEPRFPNDREQRPRNRRVDVSFLTVEEKTETPPPVIGSKTIVEWVKQPVAAPAAWIERAIRHLPEHKRSVDAYRFETTETRTTLGPKVFLNRGPVAADDSVSVTRGQSVLIEVLANDSDPDHDALVITALAAPAHGSVSQAGSGVQYTPNAGFVGSDHFTYSISDGAGGVATATVTVQVGDRPPVANADTASTVSAATVVIPVLANDADPDGDALNVTTISAPAHGSASITGDGQVSYTANADFVGTDSFTYTITDSFGSTAQATVTVTVAAANHPPIAVDDHYEVMHTNLIPLPVLANDSDPDGDALTIVSNTQPANGRIIVGSGGQLAYVARFGFCGVDTFTYTIRDAQGLMASAVVTINVLD